MACRNTIVYLQSLAVIATGLLWGVLLANGGVKALLFAVWHGRISDEIPLRTTYSGFPPLDYPISLLVAFFFYGTDGHDKGYHLFLVDAYSALQPAFVWLPIIFGILWQCFGGAIALPLYFMIHLPWVANGHFTRNGGYTRKGDCSRKGGCMRVVNAEQIFAIPCGFFIGAMLPAIVGMGSQWFGSGARSLDAHQLILGLWQLVPVWVSCIQMVVSKAYAIIRPTSYGSSSREQSDKQAYHWTRTTYLLTAAMSGAGHLFTIWGILKDDARSCSFVNMYVPWPFSSLSGGDEGVLVYGPWLFLQYDFIIISLSSLSWAYFLLELDTPLRGAFSSWALALILLVGAVAIGPATTVSLALWYREMQLPSAPKI
ncbi:hypothetical protein F4821DRAFT_258936 [Hypoxylon rubiginosum]|uniref:Uncharacterized protein n=1 Tax=Hypoxylon rubiginosum TaxID=110542 RepID=A0ACC0D4T4_9PEZI|nr:hypothetical protein F4821DRAFT_258936 [Hypoxylon rubiginosum]